MKASVVADGWDRLRDAARTERSACRTVVMAELGERYRAQFDRAGFFRRRMLKLRMSREADAIVRARLGLPSRTAMFVIASVRLG